MSQSSDGLQAVKVSVEDTVPDGECPPDPVPTPGVDEERARKDSLWGVIAALHMSRAVLMRHADRFCDAPCVPDLSALAGVMKTYAEMLDSLR